MSKTINRRRFVNRFLSSAGTAAAMSAAAQGRRPAQATSPKRNVLLIVTDDQGQDAGCYGNPVVKTPNLDALAADGVLFQHAYATTASCSASRSVILTGLYNHRNGIYGHIHGWNHFRSFDHIVSLPAQMKKAGYRTASVGKYHVAPEEVFPFDHFLSASARSPIEMANAARNFIEAKNDKPFFLYYCHSDPHRGGGRAAELPHAPDRFGNRPEGYPGIRSIRYDPDEVIVPDFLPDTPACRAELAQYYQAVSRIDQGLGRLIEILKESNVYNDTLILYISDHGIAFPGGKTNAYEPGLKCPCVVRNPYGDARGTVNRSLITWADIAPTILDFAGAQEPTYDQIEVPPFGREHIPDRHQMHGRSFLPVLEQEKSDGWDEIYASHTFHEIQMYYPMRIVRGHRYKLIWNIAHELSYPFATDLWQAPTWQDIYQKVAPRAGAVSGMKNTLQLDHQAVMRRGRDVLYGKRSVYEYLHRPEFELYDLEEDPNELSNLADDRQHSAVLEEYQQKLFRFQERTLDPWLLKWYYE